MQQELNYFTREWHGQTVMNPLGLAVLLVLSVWLLVSPRNWAMLAFIVAACFIAPGQRLVVASLDFTVLRILVLVGSLRVFVRGEYRPMRWTSLDTVLIAWSLVGLVLFSLQRGTLGAVVLRLGETYDALGFYFVFRSLIRSVSDLRTALLGFACIALPVAVAFLIESRTRHNVFSYFGGVPEITQMREGKLRCQGAFAHPILAGCFWATLLPFFLWLRLRGGFDRTAGTIGVICTLLINFWCASSTPTLSIMAVLGSWLCFPMRAYTRSLRWLLLLTLIALHLTMQAPVWHLLSRVNISSGSTGWHRYYLIDRAIYHFNEWWMLGTPTTWHWGTGLVDITNQYVLEGVNGGFLTMLLFIATLALAFRQSGRMRVVREGDPISARLGWALGCSFLAHALQFLGVSYFGQITVLWYLPLAVAANLCPSDQQWRALKLARVVRKTTPRRTAIPDLAFKAR